jgi:hypothetical protein
MTIEQLAALISATKQRIDIERSKLELLEKELVEKVSDVFASEMAAKQKTHGSVTGEIDGVKMTWEVKQSVQWDQAKLRALWEALPIEVGNKLIETKFSVKESVFSAQVDPKLTEALKDARTTKLSYPSIKLC